VSGESPAELIIGATFLGAFVVLVGLTVTHTIDDVAWWLLTHLFTVAQLHTIAVWVGVGVVAAAVAYGGLRGLVKRGL
jgi:hypothetical protein